MLVLADGSSSSDINILQKGCVCVDAMVSGHQSGMSNSTHKAVAMETGSGIFEIVF